jgi:Fe-S-cluster containining protein
MPSFLTQHSSGLPASAGDEHEVSWGASLCSSCGLCCNGVLFDTVHLQSSDSPQELKALGMHVKHKKKYNFFDQPCSSFKAQCCSIYKQRPERCRLFECQQLKRLAAGETTVEKALEMIEEAISKVVNIQRLLHYSGKLNPKKRLSQQYEKVIAEPLNNFSNPHALENRAQLVLAFEELQKFLDAQFRLP